MKRRIEITIDTEGKSVGEILQLDSENNNINRISIDLFNALKTDKYLKHQSSILKSYKPKDIMTYLLIVHGFNVGLSNKKNDCKCIQNNKAKKKSKSC